MSTEMFYVLDDKKLTLLLDTLRDVQAELEVPEVAELTSLALDRKVEEAIAVLEGYKGV